MNEKHKAIRERWSKEIRGLPSEVARDLYRTPLRTLMEDKSGNLVRVEHQHVKRCLAKGFKLVDEGPMAIDPGWHQPAEPDPVGPNGISKQVRLVEEEELTDDDEPSDPGL